MAYAQAISHGGGKKDGEKQNAVLIEPLEAQADRALPTLSAKNRLKTNPAMSKLLGVPGQETWPGALSCCASSRLRVSPLSGFHRSLTPLG
ncbi:hypothetical protein [Achromobacter xylosoxidans]|uniref:hypothetical protein n=1 Tax=Alcaligenes xylosoxydans xylosoxydans TaxID=85698 RepID=UPI001290452A|nr:hypothetical protein [Achromobacter xylosoxidans]